AGNYVASGFLSSQGLGVVPLTVVLAVWGVLACRVFDNTRAGLAVAVLTAVGGPLIEVFLVNAPWWDLYAYNRADILGIN
ncbi:unnamed protein product, partial [Polarella glacialis]